MIQKELKLIADIKPSDEPLANLIGNEWFYKLGWIFKTRQFHRTANLVAEARIKGKVYPKNKDVFNAYRLVQPSQCKVVIIGQDPYPNKNAHGLAFSCAEYISSSLRIVLKEIDNEYEFGADIKQHCYLDCNGDLTYWTEQGVLLLNSALTVGAKSGSHSDFGWNYFVRESIKILLMDVDQPKVFMLWGGAARDIVGNIPVHEDYFREHYFIITPHPVVESYNEGEEDVGFYGSNCFLKANHFLKKRNIPPIVW